MFTDHEHYERLRSMLHAMQVEEFRRTKSESSPEIAAINWALKAIEWSERAFEDTAAQIEQLNCDTQRLIGRAE